MGVPRSLTAITHHAEPSRQTNCRPLVSIHEQETNSLAGPALVIDSAGLAAVYGIGAVQVRNVPLITSMSISRRRKQFTINAGVTKIAYFDAIKVEAKWELENLTLRKSIEQWYGRSHAA